MEKKKYPRITYRINYCSNEDPEYSSAELLLQSPECKGWQTSRYCSYPVVLVIESIEPVRLRQITVLAHQHKIPTRIQIEYRLGNDQPFKRLGHFSMSPNEETNFTVRELKNVPVDISCSFLKLTVYKNHMNKFNMFNQVGLISVCLFGEKLQLGSKELTVVQQPEKEQQEGSKHAEFDKNTMNKLRELEAAKRRAVQQENYEQAKEIKMQIDNLKKVGAKLSELEQHKRIAVEREDYDSARIIQDEIKKILNGGMSQSSSTQQNQPHQQQYQPGQHNMQREQPKRKEEPDNYRVKNQQEEMASVSPVTRFEKKEPPKRQEYRQQPENPDDRPINGGKKNQYPPAEPEEEQQQTRERTEAEPLKGEFMKIADQYSQFFSEEVFRMVFSKNFVNREAGLEEVKSIIAGSLHPDKPGMVAATLTIVRHTIEDKIASVAISAMDLFEVLVKKYKPNSDPSGSLDPILQKVFDYQAHNSDKVKKVANQLFADLPNFQLTNKAVCIKALMVVDKKAPPPKTMFARLEALSSLVENYKAGNLADECVQFAVRFVDDKSSEVRMSSMGLIRRLIEEIGYGRVSPFLKNVRPPIIKSIESMVQDEVQSNRQDVPIPVGRRQQQQPKYEDDPPSPKAKKQSKQQQPRNDPPPKPKENVQQICQFCKKHDPNFINDNYRDLHLFNACPMLVQCQCGQAVQVSALTSHLLSECSNSKYYKRCPRCKEAIHQRNYRAHTEAKECNPAKPLAAAGRCPLCHEDIDYGEEGWRKHLAVEGCPNHNRGN